MRTNSSWTWTFTLTRISSVAEPSAARLKCILSKTKFSEPQKFLSHANSLKYDQEDTCEVFTKTVNKSSTRVCRFSYDGNGLITGNATGGLAFLDASGKVKSRVSKAFANPIYSLMVINENIISVGDDDGAIKIFDVRNNEVVWDVHEQKNGTVSDMDIHSSMHYLLATNTNGTLGVYDLRVENSSKNKLYSLSDDMDESLNCLSIIRDEKFVAVGSEEGVIQLFKWDYWGDSKDRILGHPEAVECMIPYNQN
jgi:WD40 repeat protein